MRTLAQKVFDVEITSLQEVASRLDASFEEAVNAILEVEGRLIVCGMGKSGYVARKIAATFTSTGTPSFFMHPAEAFHGDLGMISSTMSSSLIIPRSP